MYTFKAYQKDDDFTRVAKALISKHPDWLTNEGMVENPKDHSLIAQQIVIDHVNHVGGLRNVVYPKELLLSAAAARQKYPMYLEDQRFLK